MAKLNGQKKKPRVKVLDRMSMVVQAYHSIDYEPMSLRAVYYRVVSIFGLPKTEQTYTDFQRVVSDMRDYGILPFDLVLDGGRSLFSLKGYTTPDEFLQEVSNSYRKNYWATLPDRVIVTVEKRAMIDILYPVCQEYGVSLMSTSGFNSKTGWWALMQQHEADTKLHILMLTDLDTSGSSMINGGREAIIAHDMIGKVVIKRIGLTPEQVRDMELPTRADKGDMDFACELDAMTPNQARDLLRAELSLFIDDSTLEMSKLLESEERKGLSLLQFR